MAISAVSLTTKEPIQAISLKTQRPETDAEKEALQSENAKAAEVMLFAQKTQYATQAPKLTATSKPTFEHTGAAVASVHTSPSLFTTNNEGRLVAATGYSHAAGGVTELASALSEPEANSKGGDKKEEGNTYLSAHKKLSDVRMEALDDDIRSIMELC